MKTKGYASLYLPAKIFVVVAILYFLSVVAVCIYKNWITIALEVTFTIVFLGCTLPSVDRKGVEKIRILITRKKNLPLWLGHVQFPENQTLLERRLKN